MADISMCYNRQCSKRASCYRYTAPACKYRQTYLSMVIKEVDGCPMFWQSTEQPVEEIDHRNQNLVEEFGYGVAPYAVEPDKYGIAHD